MIYRVNVSDEARDAIRGYVNYIAVDRQEPINAEKVWTAIWEKIATLEIMPHRCPEARESAEVAFTVRALVIKKTIVVLYRVDEESKTVFVLGLRTGGQQRGKLLS